MNGDLELIVMLPAPLTLLAPVLQAIGDACDVHELDAHVGFDDPEVLVVRVRPAAQEEQG